MGLWDKLNDAKNMALETANTAAQKAGEMAQSAKESREKAKEERERKKAEAEAMEAEMREKANAFAQEIIDGVKEYVDGSQGGVFSGVDDNQILKFTKEFYEKILLPGSKTSSSIVSMHPYIDSKKVRAFGKTFSDYDVTAKPVIYIKDDDGQEILLTTKNFYFKLSLPDDQKYYATGSIPCADIDMFSFEEREGQKYAIKCDEHEITQISLQKAFAQDFISLSEYFRCFRTSDFDITEEEVDALIQKKLGSKIYGDIRKYMVYDDELVLFYAGGLDSMTATDYVACTTQQVIIVDREMLGATANVKQFYYEDITSMATIQNSNSNDLLVAIIDTALTAAFNLCDLVITVAGSANKISTLNTIEAGRVIAIYHEKRKNLKEQKSAPQMVIQKESQPDILEQISKMSQMKDAGILSEEEFNAKKAELLAKM